MIPGRLYVLSGAPAMGKTSLALTIMEHLSIHEHRPVVYFSPLMRSCHMLGRLLASLTGIEIKKFHNVFMLNPEELERISTSAQQIYEAPFYLNEDAEITGIQICEKIRDLSSREKLALAVIDNSEFISIKARSKKKSDSWKILKKVALQCRIPILLIRDVKFTRNARRPNLSDLRGTGVMGDFADLVMFLHRGNVYKPDELRNNIAELSVQMNRCGPTGTLRLRWNADLAKLSSLLI